MLVDTIYNENCVNGIRKLPDECIDLTLTSPPYDDLREYNKSSVWSFDIFKIMADELYRVMKNGGVVVWVVGDKTVKGNKSLTSFKQALYFQEIGFNMYDVMIYEKAGSGPPHPNRYFNAFEYMFVLSKGKPKTVNLLRDKLNKWGGTETFSSVTRREKDGTLTNKGKKTINEFGVRTNIWRYANGKGFSTKDEIAYRHPAIFPEKLAEDHIRSWSTPGDVVLDPFLGSGTTAIMAVKTDRRYIGYEIDKEYFNICCKRLDEVEKIF